MKKIFMLLMIAGTTLVFTACDNTSSEGTVVETDTVDVSTETEYEVEQTIMEVDTTVSTETETIEVEGGEVQ